VRDGTLRAAVELLLQFETSAEGDATFNVLLSRAALKTNRADAARLTAST
jgi:hypothetical protein